MGLRLEFLMTNIILFNLITLNYFRNRHFNILFLLSLMLDIYSFNFIGIHAFFTLIICDFFKKNFKFSISLVFLMFINLFIHYFSEFQTFIFYGYSNIEISFIFIFYALICSYLFTIILQRNI